MAKQKRYANTANRRKANSAVGAANRLTHRQELVPTLGAKSSGSITLTFPQPIVLKGTPAYGSGSLTVNAATAPTPNTLALVFNGSLVASIPLTIPFEDPAVRNAQGGYVRPGAYTFS